MVLLYSVPINLRSYPAQLELTPRPRCYHASWNTRTSQDYSPDYADRMDDGSSSRFSRSCSCASEATTSTHTNPPKRAAITPSRRVVHAILKQHMRLQTQTPRRFPFSLPHHLFFRFVRKHIRSFLPSYRRQAAHRLLSDPLLTTHHFEPVSSNSIHEAMR